MSSIPYSRYLIRPVSWYSFLIMSGAVIAVILACREERRSGLPKDTVIDLTLRILPCGIVGARIYYIVFSWDQFRNDLSSVFRIWEGGLAIYGGIIAGLVVLILFSRKRHLSPLLLCDLIVPGLAFAQSIGRWGNWFNIEAYGLKVSCQDLCFFPFAVQVPADGYSWHLATFFYESVWDMLIFIFLLIARRRLFRHKGDAFFFYVFLYASGRLVIEELRMDSLYAASSVRISQLLSIVLCLFILFRYAVLVLKYNHRFTFVSCLLLAAVCLYSLLALSYAFGFHFSFLQHTSHVVLFLSFYALLLLVSLFTIYSLYMKTEVEDACNQN